MCPQQRARVQGANAMHRQSNGMEWTYTESCLLPCSALHCVGRRRHPRVSCQVLRVCAGWMGAACSLSLAAAMHLGACLSYCALPSQEGHAARMQLCAHAQAFHASHATCATPTLTAFCTNCLGLMYACTHAACNDSGCQTAHCSCFISGVWCGISTRRAKYTDIPNKGTLATISNDDKSFECHLYLAKVRKLCMGMYVVLSVQQINVWIKVSGVTNLVCL